MHHMTTPTTERVRLTISVTPEVHATFLRLSKASGMSISRAMGEWLGDTLDAAEFTAVQVEKARTAPAKVARNLHAYSMAMAQEAMDLLDRAAAKKGPAAGAGKRSAAPAAGPSAPFPPSSNTGGKVPKQTGRRGGKDL